MRRRRFIAAVVSATGAGLLPANLAEAAVNAPNRLDGSVTLPTAINDIAADIWKTGAAYVSPASAPARAELLDVALWQWAQAHVAAKRSARNAEQFRRALTVEAEAARQCAMIYGDRRQRAAAVKMYGAALRAAQEAGNHEMTATIYTGRAYMPLYAGKFERSIDTATTALSHLAKATRPGGRAAVAAYALLARSYAALGDTHTTEQAMRLAYGSMGHYRDAGSASLPAPHHPQRFAWVKLRLATAEVYASLGDGRRHAKAYEAAMSDSSVSQMHRPMLDMGRAEVTRDPAAAAHHALTILRGYDHPPEPIVGRARAVAIRAAQRDPRSDTVQALRLHLLRITGH
jgi:tetratricopeptide (TPR) repeat protein